MFLPLAQKRRSIRKYLDQKVEAEKIDSIVEAVLRAPTSRGRHSWEFVIVTDPGLLDTLSRSRPIVVLGNPQICDVWVEDASIASIYIHLAATALDLGSCWIQIREREHDDTQTAEAYIADTLNLAPHLKVESIIAVGYPAESKPAHPKEDLPYDKVSLNNYGTPYPGGI
jgi:nitroreductase